jgi:hypothetical protein
VFLGSDEFVFCFLLKLGRSHEGAAFLEHSGTLKLLHNIIDPKELELSTLNSLLVPRTIGFFAELAEKVNYRCRALLLFSCQICC